MRVWSFLLVAVLMVMVCGRARRDVIHPVTVELREAGPDGSVARLVTVAQRADGTRVEVEVISPGTPWAFQTRMIHQVSPDYRVIKVWDAVGMKATGAPWSAENVKKFRATDCLRGVNCQDPRVPGSSAMTVVRVVEGEPEATLFDFSSARETLPRDAILAQFRAVGAPAGLLEKVEATMPAP